MLEINKIYCGDCLDILKHIPDESINCCITSPPYWALRDYGVEGQVGLEPTFDDYVNRLCDICDEVKRVLRKDGTCWVVIGDNYSGSSMTGGTNSFEKRDRQKHRQFKNKSRIDTLPPKCLTMVPFRFAIEMVNRGWILRNTIIWYKPNAMPQSVKDRFTVDFEYIFFFVKNKKYWFEQQLEKYTEPLNRWGGPKIKTNGNSSWDKGTGQLTYRDRYLRPNKYGKNKRCVWNIPTKPFKGAHFAVYPPDLIEPIVKAGCPPNGIVLDPFFGSGTTGIVALKLNRNYIGIELNPEYCKIAYNRIKEFLNAK